MNTLIVYSTKYGCTEKCAKMLLDRLNGKIELHNLKESKDTNVTEYDKVIIGGSIYMGKIQKEVSEFCSKNLDMLKEKKIGLFTCGIRDGNIADTQLNDSFPQEILSNAIAKETFGGEFIFNKMKFMDKFIAKKVAKADKDLSTISEESINKFAQLMNKA